MVLASVAVDSLCYPIADGPVEEVTKTVKVRSTQWEREREKKEREQDQLSLASRCLGIAHQYRWVPWLIAIPVQLRLMAMIQAHSHTHCVSLLAKGENDRHSSRMCKTNGNVIQVSHDRCPSQLHLNWDDWIYDVNRPTVLRFLYFLFTSLPSRGLEHCILLPLFFFFFFFLWHRWGSVEVHSGRWEDTERGDEGKRKQLTAKLFNPCKGANSFMARIGHAEGRSGHVTRETKERRERKKYVRRECGE